MKKNLSIQEYQEAIEKLNQALEIIDHEPKLYEVRNKIWRCVDLLSGSIFEKEREEKCLKQESEAK